MAAITALSPITLDRCPTPVVSSSRTTLPGPHTLCSPSLVCPSSSPARKRTYCRRGVGCQSPSQPAGKRTKANALASVKAERSSGGAGGANFDVLGVGHAARVGVIAHVSHAGAPVYSTYRHSGNDIGLSASASRLFQSYCCMAGHIRSPAACRSRAS